MIAAIMVCVKFFLGGGLSFLSLAVSSEASRLSHEKVSCYNDKTRE